jgi:hypothetical protein
VRRLGNVGRLRRPYARGPGMRAECRSHGDARDEMWRVIGPSSSVFTRRDDDLGREVQELVGGTRLYEMQSVQLRRPHRTHRLQRRDRADGVAGHRVRSSRRGSLSSSRSGSAEVRGCLNSYASISSTVGLLLATGPYAGDPMDGSLFSLPRECTFRPLWEAAHAHERRRPHELWRYWKGRPPSACRHPSECERSHLVGHASRLIDVLPPNLIDVLSPNAPWRARRPSQESLWLAIRSGGTRFIACDGCPARFSMGAFGLLPVS